MKKKTVYMSFVAIVSMCFMVSCANFEKVAQQNEIITGEQATEQQVLSMKASLGDINDDGKEERLEIDDTILKLMSGSRVVQKFEVSDDVNYMSVKALNADVDNDNEQEIIAMLGCSGDRTVYNVYIIDKSDDKYRLISLPEEIESNMAVSGITASVKASDDFKYTITKDNLTVTLDASRIYKLSMVDDETYEKLQKKWNDIVNSDFHGEVLGIYDVTVSKTSDNETELRVYEYITGGDDAIIGYLVATMTVDKEGNCVVNDIQVMERSELMP